MRAASMFGFGLLALAGCQDPCELDPCSPDASCAADGELAVCACLDGFAGDGESCCPDGDGDAVCDAQDNCLDIANADQEDFNDDGLGDECDTIVIYRSELSDEASFFEYEAAEVTVHYFAVLDEQGEPHLAADACDVCYGAKKGYRQDGDEMVCNNCGQRFPIDGIGDDNQTGGCNPGYVPIELTEVELLVEPESLEAVSWYFE